MPLISKGSTPKMLGWSFKETKYKPKKIKIQQFMINFPKPLNFKKKINDLRTKPKNKTNRKQLDLNIDKKNHMYLLSTWRRLNLNLFQFRQLHSLKIIMNNSSKSFRCQHRWTNLTIYLVFLKQNLHKVIKIPRYPKAMSLVSSLLKSKKKPLSLKR